MSFAGHVLDMISRMKQNQALKNNKRNHYNKLKELYLENTIELQKNNLTKQKVSNDELKLIKDRIKNQLGTEQKKKVTYSILLTFIIFSALAIYFYSKLA